MVGGARHRPASNGVRYEKPYLTPFRRQATGGESKGENQPYQLIAYGAEVEKGRVKLRPRPPRPVARGGGGRGGGAGADEWGPSRRDSPRRSGGVLKSEVRG